VEVPARQWLHPSSKKKPLTVSSGDLLQTSTKESAGI
jgi:hypothetical protein